MKISSMIEEEPTIAGVNIVPVIDLCLVLLIILMVTSPLLETAEIPVKLPKAVTIESKERNISITYSLDGQIAFNTDIIQKNELVPMLKEKLAEDPNILLILRVDKGAQYVDLTDLIGTCKKAGAKKISIGIEQKMPERDG